MAQHGGAILEAIHVAPERGAAMQACDAVQVLAGAGIVGDRHGRRRKAGCGLTLVEAEVIEALCREFAWPLDSRLTRRNLVTRGVRLNALVGREFRVGSLLLRGVELCEPCGPLGRSLATPQVSASRIVRLLAGRGGLRAEVLSGGVLRIGDALELPSAG